MNFCFVENNKILFLFLKDLQTKISHQRTDKRQQISICGIRSKIIVAQPMLQHIYVNNQRQRHPKFAGQNMERGIVSSCTSDRYRSLRYVELALVYMTLYGHLVEP